MPHSRGGPHRLGGRAAPLRCRDAQASPRRIAEAAVLVPTLVPDPRFRHPASGTRPPAPGIWHLASGLRLGTRFPDARSVDAAPISERWKIQLFRRSFLYPSPCPRQPHSCSASVHRLPRPPVLSALFCLPSFRYFTSSLVRAARRPLRAASCRLALLIACRRALFSTSCRHLVSPPRVAVVLRLRVAVVLRLRAAVSGRFLPPLPRTLPLFPGRTLPDTSSLERGAGCSVRGLPIKQKSSKICSLVVIYSPFRLNIC